MLVFIYSKYEELLKKSLKKKSKFLSLNLKSLFSSITIYDYVKHIKTKTQKALFYDE